MSSPVDNNSGEDRGRFSRRNTFHLGSPSPELEAAGNTLSKRATESPSPVLMRSFESPMFHPSSSRSKGHNTQVIEKMHTHLRSMRRGVANNSPLHAKGHIHHHHHPFLSPSSSLPSSLPLQGSKSHRIHGHHHHRKSSPSISPIHSAVSSATDLSDVTSGMSAAVMDSTSTAASAGNLLSDHQAAIKSIANDDNEDHDAVYGKHIHHEGERGGGVGEGEGEEGGHTSTHETIDDAHFQELIEEFTRIVTHASAEDLMDLLSHSKIDETTLQFIQQNYSPRVSTISPTHSSHYNQQQQSLRSSISMHHIASMDLANITLDFVKEGEVDSWDLNLLLFTEKQLVALVSYMFNRCNCTSIFNVSNDKMGHFITEIASRYLDNTYHNFKHGVDICHVTYRLMTVSKLHQILSPLEVFSMLVASLGHDVGHLGVNNPFLVKAKHPLAMQYNDRSPLENMHCAILYEVLSRPQNNIFSNLTELQWREARKIIIDVILGTDMSHHFEQISKTQLFLDVHYEDTRAFCYGYKDSIDCFEDANNRLLIMELILHCADINNPYKPFAIGEAWSEMVKEEFCQQGDREKREGLEVSPMMDRNLIVLCNMQMGFIEFVVAPLLNAFVQIFPPLYQIGLNLEENYRLWGERRKKELIEEAAKAHNNNDNNNNDNNSNNNDNIDSTNNDDTNNNNSNNSSTNNNTTTPSTAPANTTTNVNVEEECDKIDARIVAFSEKQLYAHELYHHCQSVQLDAMLQLGNEGNSAGMTISSPTSPTSSSSSSSTSSSSSNIPFTSQLSSTTTETTETTTNPTPSSATSLTSIFPPPTSSPPTSTSAAAAHTRTRRLVDYYTLGSELGRGGFAVVHAGSPLFNPEAKVAIKVISRSNKPNANPNLDPNPNHSSNQSSNHSPSRDSNDDKNVSVSTSNTASTSTSTSIPTSTSMTMSSSIDNAIQREVSVLRSLQGHPNIVHLIDFFEEPHAYYMIEECVEGGELFDRIIKKSYYTEREARELVIHLFKAIQYCHSKLIIHRDLKPENILMRSHDDADDTHIKICDFGFAVQLTSQQQLVHQTCGTSGYMSPELLLGDGYSFGVDVWALGVILYIILCGYPPFYGDDEEHCKQNVLSGTFYFHDEYWSNVSSEAKDLIRRMLTVDPAHRISLTEALTHPWLTHCTEGVLASHDITASLNNLKTFQAQRKLKGAANAIIAVHRLAGGGGVREMLRRSLSGSALNTLVNSVVKERVRDNDDNNNDDNNHNHNDDDKDSNTNA